MKPIIIIFIISMMVGCATTPKPPKADENIVQVGCSRNTLISELGNPSEIRVIDGETYDVFYFRPKYQAPTGVLDGVDDLLTLVIIGPNRKQVGYAVAYDENGYAKQIFKLTPRSKWLSQ